MNIIESILLGLVQGLTEFLPVSSSGHLIILREFLGISLVGSLSFDVFLNTATLLAILYCFWGDIYFVAKDFTTQGLSSRSKKLLLAIIVGTIPAGILGFLYGDYIENIFRSSYSVAWDLIIGSIIMIVADRINRNKGGIDMKKALTVGIFQSLALMPGMSRSGVSISGGLISGLSREEAIRFSFLLLIPISIVALLKTLVDLGDIQSLAVFLDLPHILAFLTAFISGVWAVKFLIRYLSKHSFTPFIVYRILLAIVIFTFL